MVMVQGDILEFSISDSTIKNEGTIQIDIDRAIKKVISKDEGIEFQKVKQQIKLFINVKKQNEKHFI